MECIKCKGEYSVLLRKKDTYCNKCFIFNLNHKFRAALGKNKTLKNHEKVLMALSSGLGSSIMLDIINNALNKDVHKKLRIDAVCLHILECLKGEVSIESLHAKRIVQQCEVYGLEVYLIHISQDMKDLSSLVPYTEPFVNNDRLKQLNKIINGMTSTARNDYILKLKRNIFLNFAVKLNCKFVFTAETSVTLATNMLSGIVVGRGSQVEHDIGFCDSRNEIKILRPMKDISLEEAKYYAAIKNIEYVNTDTMQECSLQSVIESFVNNLQENYQATISTVCKTADKIGDQHANVFETKQLLMCDICESVLGTEDSKLSALQATNLSRAISSMDPKTFNDQQKIKLFENDGKMKSILLPFIEMTLCYGCSRTCSELKDCDVLLSKLINK